MKKFLTLLSVALLLVCSAIGAAALDTAPKKGSARSSQHLSKPVNNPVAKKTRPIQAGNQLLTPRRTPAVTPILRAAGASEIYGNVIWARRWDDKDFGVYSIGLTGIPTLNPIKTGTSLYASGGACLAGDKYVTIMALNDDFGVTTTTVSVFDANTWERIGGDEGEIDVSREAFDLTYDPTTEKIYGCFYNDMATGVVWGYLDMTDMNEPERVQIADLGYKVFMGLAATKDGVIYGIDPDGKLYNINKETGEYTLIGDTKVVSDYTVSACYDDRAGVIYYTSCPDTADDAGYLYRIDPTTAKAELICQMPDDAQMVGLFIPTMSAEPKAPSEPENFEPTFSDGSLEGTVNFTVPVKLFDGTKLTVGTTGVSYEIVVDGEVVKTAETTYGATESVPLAFDEAGKHEIGVQLKNEAGTSPLVKITIFVGKDTPFLTNDVTLKYVDGRMQLSWTPVTTGNNGGYINPEEVTYNIKRLDGSFAAQGVQVADGNFSEELTAPVDLTTYRYTVQALYDGKKSSIRMSNRVSLGSVEPPYDAKLNTQYPFDGFTIIDANNDGSTWTYANGKIRCVYNAVNPADDWLITPGVRLEAGRSYGFTVGGHAFANDVVESLECAWGTSPEVSAMTDIILPRVDITGDMEQDFTVYVTPATTGVYYFGLHAISAADQYGLFLDRVSVANGLENTAPGAAEITVTPDAAGGKSAKIDITLPTKDFAGDALTAISKAELYRGTDLIKTFDSSLTPGQTLSYDDAVDAEGAYRYSVICYNESGRGMEAVKSAFIGINVPAAPSNLVAKENPVGTVNLTWDAPELDASGYPINPENVSYNIEVHYSNGTTDVINSVKGTSYTHQAVKEGGKQDFFYYTVFAETRAGQDVQGTLSNLVAVGTPYDMPIRESIVDGISDVIIANQSVNGSASWRYALDNSTIDGVRSVDSDGGFLYMSGSTEGYAADAILGKMNISGESPVFSFYWYALHEEEGNDLTVYAEVDGELTELQTVRMVGSAGSWTRTIVPLDAFKGKTIQLHLRGTIAPNGWALIMVDNLRVYNLCDYDLAAASIQTPETARPSVPFKVVARAENIGRQEASGYSASLIRNGQVVSTVSEGAPTMPATGGFVSISFEDSVLPVAEENPVYSVLFDWAQDQYMTNNSTEERFVLLRQNNSLPPVEDLQGSNNEDGTFKLSWTPIAKDDYEFEEDFSADTYESFTTTDLGFWTLYNTNLYETYTFQNEFPHNGEGMGWILYDCNECPVEGLNDHSGDGRLLIAFSHVYGPTDSWLVSPMLDGSKQTISFWAKSANSSYPETMEVLVSSTDDEMASFKAVAIPDYQDEYGLSIAWTKFEVEVPKGTKYFAIRCTSNDCLAMLLDDLTFKAAGMKASGYKVYRDQTCLTESALSESSFVENDPVKEAAYRVTALYKQGESRPSNAVSPGSSSIENLDADLKPAKAEYYDLKGIRHANPTDGIYVIRGEGKATKQVIRK